MATSGSKTAEQVQAKVRAEWLGLALQHVRIGGPERGAPDQGTDYSKRNVEDWDKALECLLKGLQPLYRAMHMGELDLRATLECVNKLLKVIQDEMGCSNRKYRTFLKNKGFNMRNGHVHGSVCRGHVT